MHPLERRVEFDLAGEARIDPPLARGRKHLGFVGPIGGSVAPSGKAR